MDDTISRRAAIEKLRNGIAYMQAFGVDRSIMLINEVPSVDAVEVVRCRECKHKDKEIDYCNYLGITICESDYCSYAVRRTDE